MNSFLWWYLIITIWGNMFEILPTITSMYRQARSRPSPSVAAVVSAMRRLTAWSTKLNPWENRISARRTDRRIVPVGVGCLLFGFLVGWRLLDGDVAVFFCVFFCYFWCRCNPPPKVKAESNNWHWMTSERKKDFWCFYFFWRGQVGMMNLAEL